MDVAVIILHYGDVAVTRACIESLFLHENSPFSLIVVNNTLETLAPKNFSRKKLVVINNKKNLGFARGVNVGIRYALQQKAGAICLINNDTRIHMPMFKDMLHVLQRKEIGIVGPAIEFYKNGKRFFDIGGKVNTFFYRTSHEEVSSIVNRRLSIVNYVSGCCMFIKKDVFRKVGLFDETFFLYYEDADFCLRAKEKGFTTVLLPSLFIKHALSASAGSVSSFTIFHLLKSGMYFGKKYAKNPLQVFAHRCFILFQSILLFKANPKAGLAIARVLLET